MRHSIRYLSLSAALMLGACGTMAEGQTQDVTLHTPGATEARCTLDNGLRYPIYSGETVQIMRSFHAIELDCWATGNRHKTMTIQAAPNPWSDLNVLNAVVPGTAYDAASMGLYTYPDVITVDFTGMPITGYETPDYHNLDAPTPYGQPIENMGPNTIQGPAGVEYLERGVEKRDMSVGSNPFAESGLVNPAPTTGAAPAMTPSKEGAVVVPPAATTGVPSGKTAEELTRSANPTVFTNK